MFEYIKNLLFPNKKIKPYPTSNAYQISMLQNYPNCYEHRLSIVKQRTN